jgi:hypothetical protein
VDKTETLPKLVTSSWKNVFLSRPVGFGKSLLLDTLAEIFKGDRSLFKGLKISETGYDLKQHPVSRFDMNITRGDVEELKSAILELTRLNAEKEELKLESVNYGSSIRE